MLLRFLTPPTNPQEAIFSRRNPCYGFSLIADIQENVKLIHLLAKVRNKILEIIDPARESKQRPIRSPQYIKQKFFHAAIFGMQPLLEEKQFIELYANRHGLLNHTALDKICNVAQAHLKEQRPYLLPIKFELMHNDGTILARFSYKTIGIDDTPLLSLTNQLDPEKKFAKWDTNNLLRYTNVTVTICVIDKDNMHEKLQAIQSQLELASQKLISMRRIEITRIKLINSYNKRTLSLKHIYIYANITAENIDKQIQENSGGNNMQLEKIIETLDELGSKYLTLKLRNGESIRRVSDFINTLEFESDNINDVDAITWQRLGETATHAGLYEKAMQFYQNSLNTIHSISASSEKYRIIALCNLGLGVIFREHNKTQESFSFFNDGLWACEKLKNEAVELPFSVYYEIFTDLKRNYGIALVKNKAYGDAVVQFAEALQDANKCPEFEPLLIPIRSWVGYATVLGGEHNKGLTRLLEARAHYNNLENKESSLDYASHCFQCGDTHFRMKDYLSAISALQTALQIRDKFLEDRNRLRVVDCYFLLAQCHQNLMDDEQEKNYLEKMIPLIEKYPDYTMTSKEEVTARLQVLSISITQGEPDKLTKTQTTEEFETKQEQKIYGDKPNIMRILITGAGGLIGRIIAKHLTNKGHEVFGLDINSETSISPRFIIDSDSSIPKFFGKKYFVADITDCNSVKEVLKEIKPIDIVIHMAAALENQSPEVIDKVNILGTKNIFTACLDEEITHIIVASSIMTIWDKFLNEDPYCQIYNGTYSGRSEDIPKIKPDTVCALSNPPNERVAAYVASKIAVEEFVTDFTQAHHVKVICARLGSISTRNKPYSKSLGSVWCSHNDLCSFMEKAVLFLNGNPTDRMYTYFVCSDNKYLFVDMENAYKEIGYVPNESCDKLAQISSYSSDLFSPVSSNIQDNTSIDENKTRLGL